MSRGLFCRILLTVIVVVGILVFSGTIYAQGRNQEALEHVKVVQQRNVTRLMAMNGVEGIAIEVDQNGRHGLTVFTEEPGIRGLPRNLDGIPVKVIVTGKIYALAPGGKPGKPDKPPKPDPEPEPEPDPENSWRWLRPVPIGVSTGHPLVTAGTIGCRVVDGLGKVYAMSNNHVYANENNGNIVLNNNVDEADNILQPGPYDGGVDPGDAIGKLYDFEPINFSGGANIIDAAIALSSTAYLDNATPPDGYGVPKRRTVTVRGGEIVKKYGRTTGLTKGQVWFLNTTVNVGYGEGKTALFEEQIGILSLSTPFSLGGDSGSLVVTQKGNPVGLLFAGDEFGVLTFANPINAVLDTFNVEIDGR